VRSEDNGDSDGSDCGDPDRSRSIEELISSLRERSSFSRTKVSDDAIEIRGAVGVTFSCIRVGKSEDPFAQAIRKLFLRSFNRDEHDPFRDLKDTVEDEKFNVIALVDSRGKLIGAAAAGCFKIPRKQEMVVFVDNIAVDSAWRGKGLARELYAIVCERAKERAQNQGRVIRAILGEVKNEVEDFWNKLGWKRMYFYDANRALREVPYLQPPLYWDWEKGIPRKGYGPIPRHLMIWIADWEGRPLTVSELIMIIERVYFDNFLPYRSCFANERAYKRCKGSLWRLLQKTQNPFSTSYFLPFLLLTKQERNRMGLD
jgi:GNAT superfamily N-acetyltransferase